MIAIDGTRRCSVMHGERWLLACLAAVYACGPSDVSLGSKRALLVLQATTLDERPAAAQVDAGADASASDELRAAVVFTTADRYFVVEPERDGLLPGDFELRLLDPPPPDAIREKPEDLPEEPEIAFGFVVAGSAAQPASFDVGRSMPPEFDAVCESCSGTCQREHSCTEDQRCYEEEVCCSDTGCCVSGTSGDPLLRNHWARFAGVVEPYVILYLSQDAGADTRTAHAFGMQRALEAGYHLLSVRPLTGQEQDEQSRCLRQAHELALERYNASHGTSYTSGELRAGQCGGGPCPEEVIEELGRLSDDACLELGCLSRGLEWVWTPIAEPASERLPLRLHPHAVPLGFQPPTASCDG